MSSEIRNITEARITMELGGDSGMPGTGATQIMVEIFALRSG